MRYEYCQRANRYCTTNKYTIQENRGLNKLKYLSIIDLCNILLIYIYIYIFVFKWQVLTCTVALLWNCYAPQVTFYNTFWWENLFGQKSFYHKKTCQCRSTSFKPWRLVMLGIAPKVWHFERLLNHNKHDLPGYLATLADL